MCVESVVQQIERDLLDLKWIGLYQGRTIVVRVIPVDTDLRVGNAEQVGGLFDQAGQVHRLNDADRLSCEAADLLDRGIGTFALKHNFVAALP